jgi:hypothetical protein
MANGRGLIEPLPTPQTAKLMTILLKPKDQKRKRQPIKEHRDGREVLNLKTAKGKAEYRKRTWEMAESQDWKCSWCGGYMTKETATFDHGQGRGMGGGIRDDRKKVGGNSAVHFHCNSAKGSRRVARNEEA